MQLIKTNTFDDSKIELSVYTIKAEDAESFAAIAMNDTLRRKETVSCSPFMPVVMNGTLYYTFTITGSDYK